MEIVVNAIPVSANPTAQAVTSVSTAAIPIPGQGGRQIYMATVSNTAVRVRFGLSDVSAASSTDVRIFNVSGFGFFIDASVTHFRIIRDTADGTLLWWVA
jgi:hypothetical protein